VLSENVRGISERVSTTADPDFWPEDPYPLLAELRREEPLGRGESPGGTPFWAVTKHADVVRMSRDPETFCSSRGVLLMDMARELPDIPGALLYYDPPEHARYRRLVNPGFSTGRTKTLEHDIRARAAALLDRIQPGQPIDLVQEVTVPFPLLVIADLLGVDGEDWPKFYEWSDIAIAAATEMTPESEVAMIEMANYFLSLVAQRREQPSDDLVSMLCQIEADGKKLDDGELMMFYGQLLVAGNETTRNLLSSGLIALAEHPEQWQILRDDPSAIPTAVEELLRWSTPVISFTRVATRDVEVRDQQISEGDPVLLLYTSANRDEEVFGDTGDVFDVTRKPNNHVSFGFGEHFCLGAALARLEGRVFLEELVSRFERLALADRPERLASGVIAGVKSAPMVFDTPA
jgi:cytochrome P450